MTLNWSSLDNSPVPAPHWCKIIWSCPLSSFLNSILGFAPHLRKDACHLSSCCCNSSKWFPVLPSQVQWGQGPADFPLWVYDQISKALGTAITAASPHSNIFTRTSEGFWPSGKERIGKNGQPISFPSGYPGVAITQGCEDVQGSSLTWPAKSGCFWVYLNL